MEKETLILSILCTVATVSFSVWQNSIWTGIFFGSTVLAIIVFLTLIIEVLTRNLEKGF